MIQQQPWRVVPAGATVLDPAGVPWLLLGTYSGPNGEPYVQLRRSDGMLFEPMVDPNGLVPVVIVVPPGLEALAHYFDVEQLTEMEN